MKKLILIMAVSFTLLATQSCGNGKAKADKELPAGGVPASVRSAFSEKYSTVTDVKWEEAHENDQQTYKAKFTVDGKKMKAEFDANGTLIKEKEDN
jgi:hypothetical protein